MTEVEARFEKLEPDEPGYPKSLVEVEKRYWKNGLPALYVLGNPQRLEEQGIGLCGSRDVSPEGEQIAEAIGAEAARRNLPLVSGYARGADTVGHVAAIREGGRTTAVLAEGIEKFRLRREYKELIEPWDEWTDVLTVVSEFSPDEQWKVWRAMARNKTVCALSKVFIAIEPGKKGGTLDAAKKTLRQRKLLIVVWTETGEAPNHVDELVNDGAILARDEEETLQALENTLDFSPLLL